MAKGKGQKANKQPNMRRRVAGGASAGASLFGLVKHLETDIKQVRSRRVSNQLRPASPRPVSSRPAQPGLALPHSAPVCHLPPANCQLLLPSCYLLPATYMLPTCYLLPATYHLLQEKWLHDKLPFEERDKRETDAQRLVAGAKAFNVFAGLIWQVGLNGRKVH